MDELPEIVQALAPVPHATQAPADNPNPELHVRAITLEVQLAALAPQALQVLLA